MNRTEKAGRSEAGAILAHLGDLARRIPIPTIDELWIFPTRSLGTTESTVIVVSAFDESAERRSVVTAHYVVRREKGKRPSTQATVTEHGVVPADRIGRLVDGVIRRLDEDLAALPPRAVQIGGDEGRWQAMLAGFSDPGSGPRSPETPEAGGEPTAPGRQYGARKG